MGRLLMLLGLLVLAALIIAVLRASWRKAMLDITIWPGECGLLYRGGVFQRELPTGQHRFLNLGGTVRVERVGLLPRALPAHMLDVISQDRFAFRITLVPLATVIDARAFAESRPRPADHALAYALPPEASDYLRLHPVLASSALAALAQLPIEDFLSDPAAALAGIAEELAPALPGTQLDGLRLTAITLPPETRKMFTEIERARREGLASLERARAEQASLRALANAARTLAGNPELARLRLLQTMETARGSKTFILGDAGDAEKPTR